MAKLEPKAIQQEIENGKLRSSYWLVGPESLKAQELFLRIEALALKKGMAVEKMDGDGVEASVILEGTQSLSLFGGGAGKLLVVKHAEAIRNAEELAPLWGTSAGAGPEEAATVPVFFAKSLDARKKATKAILEGSTWVNCEAISEKDREAWTLYLAKRKGITLSPKSLASLLALDPWGLEQIERELEKLELLNEDENTERSDRHVSRSEDWVEDFFTKRRERCLESISRSFASSENALPLLGLLSWNARQLLALKLTSKTTLAPFLADRLRAWAAKWTKEELLSLQGFLAEVDFELKQKASLPEAVWVDFVIQALRAHLLRA